MHSAPLTPSLHLHVQPSVSRRQLIHRKLRPYTRSEEKNGSNLKVVKQSNKRVRVIMTVSLLEAGAVWGLQYAVGI